MTRREPHKVKLATRFFKEVNLFFTIIHCLLQNIHSPVSIFPLFSFSSSWLQTLISLVLFRPTSHTISPEFASLQPTCGPQYPYITQRSRALLEELKHANGKEKLTTIQFSPSVQTELFCLFPPSLLAAISSLNFAQKFTNNFPGTPFRPARSNIFSPKLGPTESVPGFGLVPGHYLFLFEILLEIF